MGNLEIIWSFLSGDIGNLVFGLLIIVALLLVTLVFYAACALADVETPRFVFCLLLVIVTLGLCVPMTGGIVYGYLQMPLNNWMPGWISAVILSIVGFILCVTVSAALYIPVLRISVKKGLLTGIFEQLLSLLLFSLLYAVLLIVLAVIQIVNKKPMNQPNPSQPPPSAQTSALLLP